MKFQALPDKKWHKPHIHCQNPQNLEEVEHKEVTTPLYCGKLCYRDMFPNSRKYRRLSSSHVPGTRTTVEGMGIKVVRIARFIEYKGELFAKMTENMQGTP